jgi:hypothetical protein
MADPVTEYQTDHDLLVRLDERYSAMHKDIREMKENTGGRLNGLESDVEKLKLWRAYLVGAFAIFNLILYPAVLAYISSR